MAQTFPQAQIYAYEPDKRTFDLLKSNLNLNQAANILSVRLGVANKTGSRFFYSHPASGLSSLNQTRPGMQKTRVQLTTLPRILKDQQIKQVDILKIDAEGAEFNILLPCTKSTFKKIKEIIVEYHDSLTPHHHSELVTKLHQQGYKILIRPHHLEPDIGIIQAFM